MDINMSEMQKYGHFFFFFLRVWRVRDHIIIYANDSIENLARKN